MANMCSNVITFTGDDLTKIRELLEQAEAATEGWLPEGMSEQDGLGLHFFNLVINDDEEDFIEIYCETRWTPPTLELEAIGKMCSVSIENLYEEIGSLEYGQTKFDIKTMETTVIALDENDFARVVEDSDGFFTLDSEPIFGIYEAYEKILYEKIDKLKLQNT